MQLKLLSVRKEKGQGGRFPQVANEIFCGCDICVAISTADHSPIRAPVCKPRPGSWSYSYHCLR